MKNHFFGKKAAQKKDRAVGISHMMKYRSSTLRRISGKRTIPRRRNSDKTRSNRADHVTLSNHKPGKTGKNLLRNMRL